MHLSVLGACGAWPEAGQACSGFLLEHQGFRLVIDLGYATVPKLFELTTVDDIDAVFISHGHPDHCADLNPLLRARAMVSGRVKPLPVYALHGALDAVLALDRPGMLDAALDLHEFTAGNALAIGPFQAETALLPHSVPNAGLRLSANGKVLAYTGDSGPSPEVIRLACDADLFIAEATYPFAVPESSRATLTDAVTAGSQATAAGVKRLLLTHLLPGVDHSSALVAAKSTFEGRAGVASGGMTLEF